MDLAAGYVNNSRDRQAIEALAVELFYKPYLHKSNKSPDFKGKDGKDSFLDKVGMWTKNPANGLITAYDGNSVVGFAMHGPISPGQRRLYADAGSEPTLDDRQIALIGVHPSARGRHIGEQLLKKAEEEMGIYGAPNLYAVCMHGKHGASYGLFTKQGYRELATYDNIAYGNPGTLVKKPLKRINL